VIHAGWLGGYGNLVVIDHGNGLATAYAHNSSLAVSVGQSVTQGDVISYVGSTGHSTGPHMHFEVRVNGAAVDPLGYL
jgi:murein DD-endopeptidase MepM/ murein hydrolase activator NlpD